MRFAKFSLAALIPSPLRRRMDSAMLGMVALALSSCYGGLGPSHRIGQPPPVASQGNGASEGNRSQGDAAPAPVLPQLSFASATGTAGMIGSVMSVSPTVLETNGISLSECAIKGGTPALPSSLAIDSTSCVISGTPTALLSPTTFTLVATNSAGASSPATVVLSVTPGIPNLSFASATGTTGTVGTAMSVSPTVLNTNGDPLSACAIKGGTPALPSSLAIDSTSCVISGTPTALLSPTTFTLVATNSAGTSSPATVVLSVTPGTPNLSFASATGTTGTVGTAMSVSPTVLNTNGDPLSACAIKGGTPTLPSYLAIDPTSCVISGTPTALLSPTTFTLVATNSAGTSSPATVVLSVTPGIPNLSFASATGTTGAVGTAMSVSPTVLNTNGDPLSACAIKGGTPALPSYLAIDPTSCVISGTPTALLSPTTFTLVATNSAGASSPATVVLSVNPGIPNLSFASATGTTGTVGTAMSVSPTVLNTNGDPLSACAIKGGTPALPSYLAIDPTSCVISGTPTAVLSPTTFTLIATNSAGASSPATVVLSVNLPPGGCNPFGSPFGAGDGSAGSPYLICTFAHLTSVNGDGGSHHYKLMADLDLGSVTFNGIAPGVDIFSDPMFSGTFDGNSHTISRWNGPNGFFGLTSGATIRDLSLTGAAVSGSGYATGILIGYALGGTTVTGCHAGGTVDGGDQSGSTPYLFGTGGLIGVLELGTVDTSSSSAAVSASGSNAGYAGTGGLIGFMDDGGSALTNSFATGNVSGLNQPAGGLVGWSGGADTISRSYAAGAASGDQAGGLVGYEQGSQFFDCYALGPVVAGSVGGGLIGTAAFAGSITRCFSSGLVSGPIGTGGLVGLYSGVSDISLTSSYFNLDTSGQSTDAKAVGLSSAQMIVPGNFSGWDFTNVWEIGSSAPFLKGVGP